MTREFNQQRRYDPRPSFRNTPSNFHGDERPSGPTRPRLNREIVDRAWENGAANRHPDYQPRQNGKPYGQAPRNAWQKKPYGTPSSPNGPAGNRPGPRPYTNHPGNRQDGNTHQYRQPNGYQKHDQRPFNDDHGPRRQSFDRQQNGPARYPANESREYRPNNAPWHSGNPGTGRYTPGNQQPPRSRYQDSPQGRGPNFRPAQPQPYNNRGRNDGQRFQGGQRTEGFERGYNGYNNRGPQQGNFRQRDNGYQARPQSSGPGGAARPNRWNGQDRRDTVQRRPYAEQFEGDYERFGFEHTGYAERRGKEAPAAGARYEQTSRPTPQRHTTPLSDGRVLKGPRPVQRRQAQFWNNVSTETSSLLNQPQATAEQKEQQALNQAPAPADRQSARQAKPQPGAQVPQQAIKQEDPAAPSRGKKPVRRIASAERRKKAATSRAYPPGPRPSQRGFKWPTP